MDYAPFPFDLILFSFCFISFSFSHQFPPFWIRLDEFLFRRKHQIKFIFNLWKAENCQPKLRNIENGSHRKRKIVLMLKITHQVTRGNSSRKINSRFSFLFFVYFFSLNECSFRFVTSTTCTVKYKTKEHTKAIIR